MYLRVLQELYYKERKKLEDMWIYKQESKLKLLQLKNNILKRQKENLKVPQLLERTDIAETVKDSVIRENDNELSDYIEKLLQDGLEELEKDEQDESRNTKYSPLDLAEYLFQLEKVYALESELENNRLFPEAVFAEYIERSEKEKQEK